MLFLKDVVNCYIYIRLCFYIILHLLTKLHPNRIITSKVMTSYQFYKVASTESVLYLQVRFYVIRLGMSKSICTLNFDEMS